MGAVLTKQCNKCGVEKPLSEFRPAKDGKHGVKAQCRKCISTWEREHYNKNRDEYRSNKSAQMRRRRADPAINERINELRRNSYGTSRRKLQQTYLANLREKHFFVWRARLWSARYKTPVTSQQLAALWRRQRGRCALSGIKLDRTAELDHVVPQSQGGAHTIENLRWLDPRINYARREMPDEQFIWLCRQVVKHAPVVQMLVERCAEVLKR